MLTRISRSAAFIKFQAQKSRSTAAFIVCTNFEKYGNIYCRSYSTDLALISRKIPGTFIEAADCIFVAWILRPYGRIYCSPYCTDFCDFAQKSRAALIAVWHRNRGQTLLSFSGTFFEKDLHGKRDSLAQKSRQLVESFYWVEISWFLTVNECLIFFPEA